MDEKDYMEEVGSGLPSRAEPAKTEAQKAFEDQLDIRPPADPVVEEDAPHVDEEDESPLPEGGEEAMMEAQRYGFSPDEARILAQNGLVTRIRTMRESLESKGETKQQDNGARAAEAPVPDESGSSDAGLVETVKALQRELQEVKARVGRVPDAVDDHIIASGRGSVFGEGRHVAPDSQQAENRQQVRDAVETLRAGLRAQGKAVPQDAELVRRAIAMTFGDTPRDARQVAVATRQKNFTARPSSVREPELPEGFDRAVAGAAAKLRSYGLKG